MITAETQEKHAQRLIETTPTQRLKVLLLLARKYNYWTHVDWGRVAEYISAAEQEAHHGR